MPSQKNINEVEKLKDQIKKAKTVVLTDYKGLNVDKLTKLRQKIKNVGGEFKVTKNTLLKIALKNTRCSIKNQHPVLGELSGPTAILFSFEDELTPLKTLYDFAQENELPKIKFGFLEDRLVEQDRLIELAKLPSKKDLQAKLVGVLNSPTYGLVYVLKANINNLVGVLKQIKLTNPGVGKKGVIKNE